MPTSIHRQLTSPARLHAQTRFTLASCAQTQAHHSLSGVCVVRNAVGATAASIAAAASAGIAKWHSSGCRCAITGVSPIVSRPDKAHRAAGAQQDAKPVVSDVMRRRQRAQLNGPPRHTTLTVRVACVYTTPMTSPRHMPVAADQLELAPRHPRGGGQHGRGAPMTPSVVGACESQAPMQPSKARGGAHTRRGAP